MICKYSDATGYTCPHESLEDSDYCIFHLQDDNKDVDEFNKGIKEILETEEDSINFHGFYFPPGTSDFSKQNFKKSVSFDFAKFSGNANFYNTEFTGNANFWKAEFSGNVDFFGTEFSGNANFDNAEFIGNANFLNTQFLKEANFRYSKFKCNVDFFGTEFSRHANFDNAEFIGNAKFCKAEFTGNANFCKAEFTGNANFYNAEFTGNANFYNAEFTGNAEFWKAEFTGNANFWKAEFTGNAEFNETKFLKEANFRETKFSGNANFYNAKLTGKFEFIPEQSKTIIFENTYFSDNIRIKTDLSKCSFANSNIERVDMTDSIWIRDDDKPKNSFSSFFEWFKSKVGLSETPIIIWEGCKGELSSNWKKLEGIYRRLKQSYQKFGDTSTAGKFYYQEMECKRKQLKGIEKHFWYLFYKKLCGYGEKPFNVIWASYFLILLSSFSYLFGGIELLGSSILKVPPNVIDYNLSLNSFGIQWAISNIDSLLEDFLLCLYTSVITFTTLGYGDVHPIGFSRVIASVEAGFGIIMTALFIFVFTRKMLR